ncbi:MAG: hypothetical protein DGJ47_000033 [Rickettsiaceae bacterium]
MGNNENINTSDQQEIANNVIVAIKCNDNLTLEHLINEGLDINYQDLEGNSMAHTAVKYGSVESLEFLLGRGVDLKIDNSANETALDLAIKLEKYSCVYSINLSRGEEFFEEISGVKGEGKSKIFIKESKDSDVKEYLSVFGEYLLVVFDRYINKKTLDASEINFLQSNLDLLIGNTEINNIIYDLDNINFDSKGLLFTITFKQKYLEKIENTLVKYERNKKLLDKGQELDPSEKLTIFEASILQNSGVLYSIIEEHFNDFLENPITDNLQILKDNSSVQNNEFTRIKSEYLDGNDPIIKNGDIIVILEDKRRAYCTESYEEVKEEVYKKGQEKITLSELNFSPYHVGMYYNNYDRNDKFVGHLSHHVNVYSQERFQKSTLLQSDIYRVDLQKIIPAKYHSALQDMYGEDWLDVMQELLEENIAQLYLDNNFDQIDYDQSIITLSNVANKFQNLGRKYKDKKDIFDCFEDLLNPNTDIGKDVICSSFVAKLLVVALCRTSIQISEVLNLQEERLFDLDSLNYENLYNIGTDQITKALGFCLKKVDVSEVCSFYSDMVSDVHYFDSITELSLANRIFNKTIKLLDENLSGEELNKKAKAILDSYSEVEGAFSKVSDHSVEKYTKTLKESYSKDQPIECFDKLILVLSDIGFDVEGEVLFEGEPLVPLRLNNIVMDWVSEKGAQSPEELDLPWLDKQELEQINNFYDPCGNTWFHYAAANPDQFDFVVRSLNEGCQALYVANKDGKTPLDIAREYGNDKFVDFIESSWHDLYLDVTENISDMF